MLLYQTFHSRYESSWNSKYLTKHLENQKKVFRKKISELEPAITKNRSSDSIMFHPQNKLLIEHDE